MPSGVWKNPDPVKVQKRLDNLQPLLPGQRTPGAGAPKGKRVSTWIKEFLDATADEVPEIGSVKWRHLPHGAQIALARIQAAADPNNAGGNKATELLLERSEGKVPDVHQFIDSTGLGKLPVSQVAPMLDRVKEILIRRAAKTLNDKNAASGLPYVEVTEEDSLFQ